jgi:hypothetical protein
VLEHIEHNVISLIELGLVYMNTRGRKLLGYKLVVRADDYPLESIAFNGMGNSVLP